MASLQERNGSYRVLFKYHDKLHSFTLGKVTPDEADAKARQVDYLLMRLKQRLIQLPPAIDIVQFVRHDGTPPPPGPALPESPRKAVALSHLKDRYLATLGNGAVEANSLYTLRIHLSHACRVLGGGLPLGEVTLEKLQGYVDKRAKEKVSAYTIKKEVRSFKAAWTWGGPMRLTSGAFPSGGLRYPKSDEKPPFMTRAEVERQIAGGGDPGLLWDCLYLQTNEVKALLTYVERHALHPWIYPAVCFAGHTGARRSEVIRSLIADVDFTGNTVLIREKKRNQAQRTTRRVPLTPFLRGVLKKWLKQHPGGTHLFCHGEVVDRSRTRSKTTGHKGEKTRASSLKGRLVGVRTRERTTPSALTRDEVHDHFKRTLRESKWEVIRGLHCLRHSFISACASKGIDQRLLQEWCGHMDEATSRRYRHLWPSVQQEAIKGVFD
jgi:site-specific recombinase XerD